MAAEPGKPEEQPVDDVWKAAAYGNMDKTKEFIEADPQLVNKPDATGYVRPTTQIQREISDRAPDAANHHLLSFYSKPPIFTAKPRSKHSRVHTPLHRRHPGSPTSPHLTNAYPSTHTGSCPCSGRRSTTESRLQPTSSNGARR